MEWNGMVWHAIESKRGRKSEIQPRATDLLSLLSKNPSSRRTGGVGDEHPWASAIARAKRYTSPPLRFLTKRWRRGGEKMIKKTFEKEWKTKQKTSREKKIKSA